MHRKDRNAFECWENDSNIKTSVVFTETLSVCSEQEKKKTLV